jgi:hypothetical protein
MAPWEKKGGGLRMRPRQPWKKKKYENTFAMTSVWWAAGEAVTQQVDYHNTYKKNESSLNAQQWKQKIGCRLQIKMRGEMKLCALSTLKNLKKYESVPVQVVFAASFLALSISIYDLWIKSLHLKFNSMLFAEKKIIFWKK